MRSGCEAHAVSLRRHDASRHARTHRPIDVCGVASQESRTGVLLLPLQAVGVVRLGDARPERAWRSTHIGVSAALQELRPTRRLASAPAGSDAGMSPKSMTCSAGERSYQPFQVTPESRHQE